MEHSVNIDDMRQQLIASFKRKPVRDSSLDTAVEVVKFLRKVVVHGKYENSSDLLTLLKANSNILCAFNPSELVIRNSFLLVQKLVREENFKLHGGDESISHYDSLNKLWNKNEKLGAANAKKLKRGLIEAVKEVVTEMETCRESIAGQASELVQPQDTIIVYSLASSPTMKAFLQTSIKRQHRTVSVVPSKEIDTTPGCATPLMLCEVGAKMCEATKVFLPGVSIFPDGSCFVPAGGLSICLAAQRHSVPVYVLASFYKITPIFIPDPELVNPQLAPGLPFSVARELTGRVQVLQPGFDLIPAALVTLYITNSASIIPSHVYRLIGDYYHPEDLTVC